MVLDPQNLCIRAASRQDFESILKNEQSCYEIPWSAASLEACYCEGYSFLVMEHQQRLIGHMIVQWILDEAHLHNVCVIPQFQSKGFGKHWMSYLIELAARESNSVIFLEVRHSNRQAIKLYTQLGFYQIGERKNYYQTPQGQENGLVMELRLDSSSSPSEDF